jgi:hypothetical protein
VEECTYFWGVNTSWGINMAESKRSLNQEDNQAPQPTPWTQSLIVPTLKNGDKINPSNCRNIMISPILDKLYGSILEKKRSIHG